MRRGQAALEFLTTYGWAFLVILVMIGALAYFGVINPNKFLPERCTFQQELTCKDYQVLDTGSVKFYVTNNLGTGIAEMTLQAKQVDGTTFKDCTPSGTGAKMGAGESLGFSCSIDSATLPSTGDKTKFTIKGTYKIVGGQYNRSIQGEIFATVQ